MEKSQEMVKEITQIRKMTPKVKEKLRKEIAENILFCILFSIYNVLINFIYFRLENGLSNILLKVLAICAILISVILVENSYRKDSSKYAVFGIESIIYSIFSLCIPKIYGYFEEFSMFVWFIFPIFCMIYYVFKSIIIYKKTKFIYQNNLSDIKEIMKDE